MLEHISGSEFNERGQLDPRFEDVNSRIQELSSGGLTSRRGRNVVKLWEELKPLLASVVNQTWQRLARFTDILETSSSMPPNRSVPAQERERERRRQDRVAVQMLSQFSSKTSVVAGVGTLRDLSPSGCRIRSPLRVPLGAAVECWIYPENGNPFAVDEARVQWIGDREFGLRFTHVRVGIQRQITNMCRVMAPL